MDFSGGVLFLVKGDYYLRDLEEGAECQLWTEQAVSYVPLIQKQVGLGLVLRELPVSLLKPTSKRITEMD